MKVCVWVQPPDSSFLFCPSAGRTFGFFFMRNSRSYGVNYVKLCRHPFTPFFTQMDTHTHTHTHTHSLHGPLVVLVLFLLHHLLLLNVWFLLSTVVIIHKIKSCVYVFCFALVNNHHSRAKAHIVCSVSLWRCRTFKIPCSHFLRQIFRLSAWTNNVSIMFEFLLGDTFTVNLDLWHLDKI